MENDGGSVPRCMKHAAIDLYCPLSRAEEEIKLIKSEMMNVLTHQLQEEHEIERCVKKYRNETLYDRGAIAFLNQKRKVSGKRLSLSVAVCRHQILTCNSLILLAVKKPLEKQN